jgi:hypothetical protein
MYKSTYLVFIALKGINKSHETVSLKTLVPSVEDVTSYGSSYWEDDANIVTVWSKWWHPLPL